MEYNGYTLNASDVLQSAKARVRVNYGHVKFIFRGIQDQNGNRRFERNENGFLRVSFTALPPFLNAHNVHLSFSSLDSSLLIGSYPTVIDSIAVNDTVNLNIPVSVSDFDSPHYASIVVNYTWDNYMSGSDTVVLKIGVDTVLVWDGSYDAGLSNYLRPFLDSLGLKYEWQSEADSGKPYLFEDYRTVLYVSGQVLPDTSTINYLRNIINLGKNVIISSQNFA